MWFCASQSEAALEPASKSTVWSRNRKEEVEGVYSHQTALSLHELSDLNPAKLHMTVPENFRRNSDIPGIVVLHYGDLSKSDFQAGPGYNYTAATEDDS